MSDEKTTECQEAGHQFAPVVRVLPDHPDSEPKVAGDLLEAVIAAIKSGQAEYLGHSEYFKDCGWEFYRWRERYFCFLNEVGCCCWEVSPACAANYVDD